MIQCIGRRPFTGLGWGIYENIPSTAGLGGSLGLACLEAVLVIRTRQWESAILECPAVGTPMPTGLPTEINGTCEFLLAKKIRTWEVERSLRRSTKLGVDIFLMNIEPNCISNIHTFKFAKPVRVSGAKISQNHSPPKRGWVFAGPA